MDTGCSIRLAQGDKNTFVKDENIIRLIDNNTAVLTLSHVEYTCGQRYDLRRWAKEIHRRGGILVVDASQSMGTIPIDVEAEGVDVLVAGGYKWLCSSFGSAIMYVHPNLHHLTPGLFGFRSHKDLWNLDATRLELPQDASRYEYATMHFGAALGMAKSIRYLLNRGVENIYEHNMSLTYYLLDELETLKDIQIISSEKTPIVSFKHYTISSDEIVNRLLQYSIKVTNRGGYVRVSPHIYNNYMDIRFFLKILTKIIPTGNNHIFYKSQSKL